MKLARLIIVILFCIWCIMLVQGCKSMPTVEGCERMVFATQEAREQCFDAAFEREEKVIERTDKLLRTLNACKATGGILKHTVRTGNTRLKDPLHGGPYTREHIGKNARLADFKCINRASWETE